MPSLTVLEAPFYLHRFNKFHCSMLYVLSLMDTTKDIVFQVALLITAVFLIKRLKRLLKDFKN